MPLPRFLRHFHQPLNQKGFHHYILPVLVFVVLFGIAGAYFYITSHAATTYVQLHIGNPNGSCVDGSSIGGCITSGDGAWQANMNGTFTLKSQGGQCLDDWGGKVGTNAKNRVYVHYTTCYNDRNQQWHWAGSGGYHELVSASGGCINGVGGGTGSGTQLIVYTCNNANNEHFFEKAIQSSTGGGGNGGGAQQYSICNTYGYGHSSRECQAVGTAINFISNNYGSWNNGTQLTCLGELWNRESGWDSYIQNPQSGAFGIAQALGHGGTATTAYVVVDYPGGGHSNGKVAVNEYPSYNANAGGALYQIIWGLSYIKSTYGTPCGAWAQEVHGGYYVIPATTKA